MMCHWIGTLLLVFRFAIWTRNPRLSPQTQKDDLFIFAKIFLKKKYFLIRDIDFASFYDFDIWFWNCSDSVVFWNCSDSVVFWNCSDSVVFFCCSFYSIKNKQWWEKIVTMLLKKSKKNYALLLTLSCISNSVRV
jgi:hypothetical protein